MSSTPQMDDALRAAIISRPDVILDDADVMRALIATNERYMGENIVDLRGIAMDRMENRLDRLEDTHRSVIAAAYDNVAGTNQIHRAILRMLEPLDFESFLKDLTGDVAEILRVDALRLVLETDKGQSPPALERVNAVLSIVEPGHIEDYLHMSNNSAPRDVTLRGLATGSDVYGVDAVRIRSEACLKLDLGEECSPGLLLLGSEDPEKFGPHQGTDLLEFFRSVFERTMRRWLS